MTKIKMLSAVCSATSLRVLWKKKKFKWLHLKATSFCFEIQCFKVNGLHCAFWVPCKPLQNYSLPLQRPRTSPVCFGDSQASLSIYQEERMCKRNVYLKDDRTPGFKIIAITIEYFLPSPWFHFYDNIASHIFYSVKAAAREGSTS